MGAAFKDKVVIVTGSSSGIGREAALLFATAGASVTVHGLSPERMKATLELLKERGVPSSRIHSVLGPIEEEATRKKLIDSTVSKFGRLDVLVNNAGLYQRADLEPNSTENLDYLMVANMKSVLSLTRLAIPHLEKTKGNVVNVSSVGSQRASPESTPYVLTKAALDHYTRCAALQYADQGIRVNTVSPGPTITNFGARDSPVMAAAMKDLMVYWTDYVVPMRRFGTAREVANVIEFLASEKASFVTGANYVVDGGILAGVPTPKPMLAKFAATAAKVEAERPRKKSGSKSRSSSRSR